MLTLAAILLGLIAAWSLVQESRHQQSLLAQESRHLVDLETGYLAEEFQEIVTDLRFLASQPELAEFAEGVGDHRVKLEQQYVRFAAEKKIYDQIRLLGIDGQELIRVNDHGTGPQVVDEAELQPKASRYYYQEASKLEPQQVFVSPFDLNVEHGQIEQPLKPVIRFLTPVVDRAGTKRGLLAFNYLGAKMLAKMRSIAAASRGQYMLVNVEGQYLQAPRVDREWGWLRNQSPGFSADFPETWRRISAGQTGQLTAAGDRFTVARFDPLGPAAGGRGLAAVHGATKVADSGATLFVIAMTSPQDLLARSQPFGSRWVGGYLGVLAVIGVLSAVWARSVSIRQGQEQQLVASEARLRKMSSLLLKTQEKERRHLSRLLHDELGQLATAIHLDLRSALQTSPGERLEPVLSRAAGESAELLSRLHEIASDVRPSVLDDLGLEQAMESYLTDFSERTSIDVQFKHTLDRRSLDSTIKENIYRIAQEALANVAKHAHAKKAELVLSREETEIRLAVRDFGCGFEVEALRHTDRLGLLGIRERVELLGGDFELTSHPGQGTQIVVTFPLASIGETNVDEPLDGLLS